MQNLSRILVTGDKGFIGSHIDFPHDGFDLIDGFDVRDSRQVEKTIPKYDCVVNLAAISDIDECDKDRDNAFRTNVIGAINVMKHAKKAVIISSASVYDDTNHPVNERYPTLPKSYYGATKLMMEYAVSGFAYANPKPCIILRPFNIIGDGSKGVNEIFKKEKELHVFGNPFRDFIPVEDVVKAIKVSIDNVDRYNCAVYNVGTGNATSIRDLARQTGKPFLLQPPKPNDIQYSCADISKIQNELGWIK